MMLGKISARQRDELLQLWQEGNFAKLRKRQKEYGVDRKYASRRAYERGIKRLVDVPKDYLDPRWQWAIERGPVIA